MAQHLVKMMRKWPALAAMALVCLPAVIGLDGCGERAKPPVQPVGHVFPLVHVFNPLPVDPPRGENLGQWKAFRQNCQEIWDKMSSGVPLEKGQESSLVACEERAQAGSAGLPSAPSGGATVLAGYLTCNVASGWGLIFGSSRSLRCAYGAQPNYTEYYKGSIRKFGADIGYLQSGVILWLVVVPTTNLGPGALEGHYGGATASAAVGVGGGANVMVGGFNNSIELQPVSIEGQSGLNVAAGVVQLSLKLDKEKSVKSE